ncbi:MAG: DHH family phosphoesterase [Bacteroidales bacterium]|nr:DHH family phosphoesterase [Bacteroidales bacterium]
MTQEDIIALKKRLSTPQNIAIVIHYNPDGDALGSSLALAMYLTKLGHHVNVLSPNIYPAYLAWMPNCDKVLLATEQLQRCESILAEADIIFCLDFNIFHRASLLENALAASKKFKVLIDHHIDPVQDFDIIYSLTTQTSSTSELVYQLIAHKFGDKHLIDKKMAECMYVGIMTDTGSLSYSCNNASTYSIVGDLMNFGIDGEIIHKRVYDNFSEDRVHLLGYCLFKRLIVLDEYSTSYIYLTKEDLNYFNYQQGDTEGIVNYGLSIKNVRFTAIFTERDERIRISFRSKGNFDVNSFAKDHFNGGGHKNASGGNSYVSMSETIDKFVRLLPQYKSLLNQPWDE